MSRDWPIFYGQDLPFKIRHMTQYAVEAFEFGKIRMRRGLSERVIYHDPCYLRRGMGITEESRIILRSIPDIQVVEFYRYGINSKCCGSGGAARKVYQENANAIGRATIDEAVRKKADRRLFSVALLAMLR